MRIFLTAAAALACVAAIPAFAQMPAPGSPEAMRTHMDGSSDVGRNHDGNRDHDMGRDRDRDGNHDMRRDRDGDRHDMRRDHDMDRGNGRHGDHRMGRSHRGWSHHVRACQQRYRSYNPRTDRYSIGHGRTRICRL
jgi:hypothetical protein